MNEGKKHPISDLMDVTINRIKEMVDSNTIIGDPVNMGDGTTVLPVSKISFGFASGGSDIGAKSAKDLFGGGSGAGITVTPVAFLVCKKNGDVRLLQVAAKTNDVDKIVNIVPDVVDKITSFIPKPEDKKAEDKQTAQSEE